MIIAKVTGTVWSTIKNPHLVGQRLLVVRPMNRRSEFTGKPLVAIDRVDAGVGDTVLINKEGGAARLLLRNDRVPVQAVIIGVVDGMEWATPGADA